MEEKKKSTRRPERQIYQPPKSVNHLPSKPQNPDRSRLSWNSRENFHKPVGSSFQYNNYGDRRPNRKPNREEHKQYANTKDIPPRFQKKFMEAYQNKPHFVQDHNQHVIRDHHHYYQQTNELINRTGQHQQHPQHPQHQQQHPQHQQHQPQQSYQQHHHQQHQQHPQHQQHQQHQLHQQHQQHQQHQLHQQHQSHVDPRSQPRRASNELPETRNDQENRGPEPQGSYSRIEPMVNHYHQGNEQKHQSWANAPIIEHTSVPHHATSNFQRVNEPLTVNKPCGVIRPTAHAYQTNNNQKLTHYPQSSNMTLQIPINYTNHGLPIEYLSSFQNCNQLIEGDKPIMAMPPPFLLQYLQNLSSQSHLANQRVGIPPPSHLTGSSFDSLNQTIVQKCISEIKQLELDLREALQKRSESGEKNPVITALLARIQALYQQVILDNPQYCKEHDVELALWNIVFYQFIKSHLQEIEKNPDSQSIKDELLSEIEVASVFFETLLAKLEAAFKFTVDEYIDRHYEEKCDDIMGAALSAQKIVLYLGDLAHYRGQALNSPNYNKAQSYYLKAHQIAPRMGMPFHRLALLAVHGRRRLEAVYNYMRSLAARVPEESSRKGLLTIFEEVKTKFEAAENERLSKSLQSLKVSEESRDLRKSGQSSEKPNNIPSDSDNKSGEEELNSLRDEELTRRFVLSFLHVHGKLFTKTGLESFDSTVHQMFMELRCLLRRSPFPMSSQRLLQMMAINMFSAYPGQQQFIQEKAIQITLTMAALLLERVDASLEKHDSVESSSVVADDVAELLPTLKIWTDWMITCYCVNDDPSFIVPQFPIGGVSDVFSLLADVLTRLEKIDLIDLKTTDFESNKRLEGYDRITLDEDTLLSGFLPLCVAPNACSYALSPGDKEKARTSLRITRIKLFGQYLCGKVKPYLVYDVGNGRFWSCVPAKTTHKVNFNQQTRANVENGAHA